MSFSIVILTYNEADILEKCLESIQWCDDIIVLDSHSHDDTLKIAEQQGARVFQRPFDDFASQRNYALQHIKHKYPWVFHLDADETFTPELRLEVEETIRHDTYLAYQVPSKMIFMGCWLKYSGMYPCFQVRLGRVDGLKFQQVGHGQKEDMPPDQVGVLKKPYLHDFFCKGFTAWFDKHNRYSSEEAEAAFRIIQSGTIEWVNLFSASKYHRRMALKKASYFFPMRPFLRFIYMYIFRMGFLDGRAGWVYCIMLSICEFMISAKIAEMKTGASPPRTR